MEVDETHPISSLILLISFITSRISSFTLLLLRLIVALIIPLRLVLVATCLTFTVLICLYTHV